MRETLNAGLAAFIRQMPKVELHVHLEGAIQPQTLLTLAQRNQVALPAGTVEGIRQWYTFTDFAHFVEIYTLISACIRTPEDIEFVTQAFLRGQADQNIRYTEVTYTPYTHFMQKGLPFAEQLAAINRAGAWAEAELGVRMGLIIDIARSTTPQEGLTVAQWAVQHQAEGVLALGLGGAEIGNPPQKHAVAFDLARAAGVPAIPHAGETVGPESIRDALTTLHPVRLEHGVRCIEDPALVALLRERQIPLDVCPTSNICLNVYGSLQDHPLPQLLDAGLYVTLNSDDPPMFNTTLTDEYLACAAQFGWDVGVIEQLTLNAVRASLLPPSDKAWLERDIYTEFARLRQQHLV